MQDLKRLFIEENGQVLVEYGLIIALVAVIVAVGVRLFGGRVNALFTKSGEQVS